MRRDLVTFVRNDKFTDTAESTRTPFVGGSREHFFHFLLGYLLPVIHEQSHRGEQHFGVLDCGPLMTPHLGATFERLGYVFDLVPNHRISRPVFVPPWDHDWEPASSGVVQTIELVKNAWATGSDCAVDGCPDESRLLLKRSAPHPYYENPGAAEVPGYGIGRRGVTNWTEISEHLAMIGMHHAVYEPGQHSLGCQIRSFSRATHVVGMRGAEWANSIWAAPWLKALVFDPHPPARTLTGLLDRCGIDYQIEPVDTDHVSIDPHRIEGFLTERGEAGHYNAFNGTRRTGMEEVHGDF
jgi:hypothetical protein